MCALNLAPLFLQPPLTTLAAFLHVQQVQQISQNILNVFCLTGKILSDVNILLLSSHRQGQESLGLF